MTTGRWGGGGGSSSKTSALTTTTLLLFMGAALTVGAAVAPATPPPSIRIIHPRTGGFVNTGAVAMLEVDVTNWRFPDSGSVCIDVGAEEMVCVCVRITAGV